LRTASAMAATISSVTVGLDTGILFIVLPSL
jgi:hypothetical protein